MCFVFGTQEKWGNGQITMETDRGFVVAILYYIQQFVPGYGLAGIPDRHPLYLGYQEREIFIGRLAERRP